MDGLTTEGKGVGEGRFGGFEGYSRGLQGRLR